MFAAALLRALELAADKTVLEREKQAREAEEAENIRRMEEEYAAENHREKEDGA